MFRHRLGPGHQRRGRRGVVVLGGQTGLLDRADVVHFPQQGLRLARIGLSLLAVFGLLLDLSEHLGLQLPNPSQTSLSASQFLGQLLAAAAGSIGSVFFGVGLLGGQTAVATVRVDLSSQTRNRSTDRLILRGCNRSQL